jgi:hypothetical protein
MIGNKSCTEAAGLPAMASGRRAPQAASKPYRERIRRRGVAQAGLARVETFIMGRLASPNEFAPLIDKWLTALEGDHS